MNIKTDVTTISIITYPDNKCGWLVELIIRHVHGEGDLSCFGINFEVPCCFLICKGN